VSGRTGRTMDLLAAGVAAILLLGAEGVFDPAGEEARPTVAATARFHAGTRGKGTPVEPGCSGPGCHLPCAHRKAGGTSAFLNLHEGRVACLACHGKEYDRKWTAPPASERPGARLAFSPGERPARPHDGLGPPASCERCHSDAGKERLSAAGVKGLGDGFASPMPMRMLREGARRWVPDDLR